MIWGVCWIDRCGKYGGSVGAYVGVGIGNHVWGIGDDVSWIVIFVGIIIGVIRSEFRQNGEIPIVSIVNIKLIHIDPMIHL